MRLALLWRFWLPPALYLSLIFVLSSLSQPPIPARFSGDFLHYPEYFLLAFLLARAIHASLGSVRPVASALLAFACSALWGVTDEFHQAFVPGRVPDLRDLTHDAVGAAVGTGLWLAVTLWMKRPGRRGAGP